MPTFTAEEKSHPNPLFGNAFAIDVLLPNWEEEPITVQSYLSVDYQRSVVSKELAARLNFQVSQEDARGEIVLQTEYEIGDEGPVTHRTRPLELTFQIAHQSAGHAYIHFSFGDLAKYIDAKSFEPISDEVSSFVALKPSGNPEDFCVVLPVER